MYLARATRNAITVYAVRAQPERWWIFKGGVCAIRSTEACARGMAAALFDHYIMRRAA